MKQQLLSFVFIFILAYGNAHCQPSDNLEPSFVTLQGMASGTDGFDGALEILKLTGRSATGMMFAPPVPTWGSSTDAVQKGATNSITLLILKELGNPPSGEEAKTIEKALIALNSSKVGKEICKPISARGCTWKDLKSAGVEITTRDLKYHLPEPLEFILGPVFGSEDPSAAVPNPSLVNGRTILCLDQELVLKNSPDYVATFILHELSHVSDNRNLGEVNSSSTKYAMEYKAHVIQMMIYDEFLRTGKLKGNSATNGIQFMLSVYRWRNGGPKPNMDYSVAIKGKKYPAAEIIGLYIKPDDTGLKALWHMTAFFEQRPEGAVSEGDLKYLNGVRGFIKELEPKYQSWFPSKPPAVVVPPNNGGGGAGGDNDGGDDNSGGGGGNPNPCPNPHFNPDGSPGC
ncbi:MAG: hypothetical protein ACYC4Q_09085 [Victivallaceae bacterium]